jgi:alpha-tubulin suppressor-like RCC1 family protein
VVGSRRHLRGALWGLGALAVLVAVFVSSQPVGAGQDTPSPELAQISSSITHTCALAEGVVSCWGGNGYGQLGAATPSFSEQPTAVVGLGAAVSVSAGKRHSCALLADGTVSCWGNNAHGQLGDGSQVNSSSPVQVLGVTDAVQLAAGDFNNCVLRADRTVSCWGLNDTGQLGNGTQVSSSTPVDVTGLDEAIFVDTGSTASCVINADQTASCWGKDYGLELGTAPGDVPEQLDFLDTVTWISMGSRHNCAVAQGSVACWGNNSVGQLGGGAGASGPLQTTSFSPDLVASVSAGRDHTCVAFQDGTADCWGGNVSGQVGNWRTRTDSPEYGSVFTPTSVLRSHDIATISAGSYYTCVSLSSGTISCFGQHDLAEDIDPDGTPLKVTPIGVCREQTPALGAGAAGYWMVEMTGAIHSFGAADNFCSVELTPGGQVVGFDNSLDGRGLWILDNQGVVSVRGSATNYGNVPLAQVDAADTVASISATPSGAGYWVFTRLGAVFAYGDAQDFGDLPALGVEPTGGVVASAATATGNGYYMLGADGGVFAFGDAKFVGSIPEVLTEGQALGCPIVGLVPIPVGEGYWLVGCDGGVFSFGDADFNGSIPGVLAPNQSLNAPVNGMVSYADGYLMVASDGGVFNFSTKPFSGSLGDRPPASPVVSITAFAP